MLKEAVIENCAPTLAGIKTGNLFSLKNDRSGTTQEICSLNRILRKKATAAMIRIFAWYSSCGI
ncbi:MAG: DUF3793 family protein [Lachnospiraceae bacterium]|nr:DUF3793 family protein [Lachnospiraceae bacterium]